MSAELPDDVARWPKDPYRLLGVERTATEADVRRAYAALIRRFKPEHHPEQFRRIRDAYEQIKQGLAWLKFQQPEDGGDGVTITWSGPAPAASDDLAQIDADLKAGRALEAYRALCERVDRMGPKPPLATRLYWTLELWPELDSQRVAADWLIAGLKLSPHDFRCRDLYRRVVDLQPLEALSARFREWMTTLPSGPLLYEAAALRWQAAASLSRWNIPAEDLELLAPLLQHDEYLAARLQLLALDYLMWRRERPLRDCCQRWLEDLDQKHHLHSELQGDFLRLDVLRDLHRGLTILHPLPRMGEMARLVTRSWTRPVMEFRQELYAFLDALVADPTGGLAYFDEIVKKAPAVLAQFTHMLEGLRMLQRRHAGPPPVDQGVVARALAFLWDLPPSDYGTFRHEFAHFCMREFVEAPVMVSLLASARLSADDQHNLNQAFHDGPMICLVQAYCLYWQ